MKLVLVVVLGLVSVMSLLAGAALVLPGSPLDAIWSLNPQAREAFGPSGGPAGAMFLVAGILAPVLAVGIHRCWRLAWAVSVALFTAVLLFNASRLLSGDRGELFGTPFTALMLGLHFHPRVRCLDR